MRHSLESIDATSKTAICSICGPTPVRVKSRDGAGHPVWRCKTVDRRHNCSERKVNRDRERTWKRRGIFSITPSQYDLLFEEQRGLCAICGMPQDGKRLAVDHDHETGTIRGLLCEGCNKALGFLKENKDSFKRGIEYLEKHGK